MNPEKNTMAIAARFAAASETYHPAASVQQDVAEALSRMFPDLPPPGRYRSAAACAKPAAVGAGRLRWPAPPGLGPADCILEIGCGTGLLTALIRQRYPGFWIDAVDVSARMIAQARTRLGFDKRIRWRVADLRHIPASCSYPLVVSSSSLHWVSPLDEGLAQLANLLQAGGWLVFSLMVRGTLGELRECRLRVAPHKPPTGTLPTLRQVRQGLHYAGLEIVDERKEVRHVLYPSAEAFLRQIHDQGLTGGAVSAAHIPLGRKEIKNLVDDYQARFSSDTGVKASYHVAYFKVTKVRE